MSQPYVVGVSGQVPFTGNDNVPYARVQLLTSGEIASLYADITDNNAKYNFQANPSSIFTDYQIHNRFLKDGHIYYGGLSSPGGFAGQSCAVFQLANPSMIWQCDWTASRLADPPVMPSPTPQDPRYVLMDQWVETYHVLVGPDGFTPFYRITGTYVYACLEPNNNLFDDVFWPQPPWLQQFASGTSIYNFIRSVPNSSYFEQGISDVIP